MVIRGSVVMEATGSKGGESVQIGTAEPGVCFATNSAMQFIRSLVSEVQDGTENSVMASFHVTAFPCHDAEPSMCRVESTQHKAPPVHSNGWNVQHFIRTAVDEPPNTLRSVPIAGLVRRARCAGPAERTSTTTEERLRSRSVHELQAPQLGRRRKSTGW